MAVPAASYIGRKQGRLSLDPAVFGERFHEALVHEAVRAELNARAITPYAGVAEVAQPGSTGQRVQRLRWAPRQLRFHEVLTIQRPDAADHQTRLAGRSDF